MTPHIYTVRSLFMAEVAAQYLVPPYQRRYGWELQHLNSLWRDLGTLYRARDKPKHFLGILLAKDEEIDDGIPPLVRNVIDGQQRVTTLAILLAALAHHHADHAASSPGPSEGWFSFYFVDQLGRQTPHPKIKLQKADQEQLCIAMRNEWRRLASQRARWQGTLRAYEYFRYCLWRGTESFDSMEGLAVPKLPNNLPSSTSIEDYWRSKLPAPLSPDPLAIDCVKLFKIVTTRIYCAVLRLDAYDGSELVVFDSINGKRLPFSQWDHCKSQFFRVLESPAPIQKVDKLYRAWARAEREFVKAARLSNRRSARGTTPFGDNFIYNLLVIEKRLGDPSANRGRAALELGRIVIPAEARRAPNKVRSYLTAKLLPTARAYAYLQSELKLPFTSSTIRAPVPPQAEWSIAQISALSSGPPEPTILLGLHCWHIESITDDQLIDLLTSTERFLMRVFLARHDFSPLRSRIMQLVAGTNPPGAASASRVTALISELNAAAPSDAEIRTALNPTTQLYSKRDAKSLAVLFRGIERKLCGSGSHVMPHGRSDPDFQVDHVYPQSCKGAPNLAWAGDLVGWGVSSAAMSERVDVLGNLGLLSRDVNRRAKDGSLATKQNEMRGAGRTGSPPLAHTQDILNATSWCPKEIDERTELLLNHALDYWRL